MPYQLRCNLQFSSFLALVGDCGISPAQLPTRDNPAGSNPESSGPLILLNETRATDIEPFARESAYALVRRLAER